MLPYDLLCTDLGLADMDGATLAAELRARDPALAVAIVTGWGALEESRYADLDAAIVTKPFSVADIQKVVSQITRRDRV